MPFPRGLFSWLAVLVAVIALFGTVVEASEEELIIERQNPSFITQLPTTASSPLVVTTPLPSSTIAPPPAVPTTSQASSSPLRTTTVTATTTTPAATRSSITIFSTIIESSSSPLATSSPTFAENLPQTSQDPSSTVGDAFFGRVPTAIPDAPIVGFFLVIFLLFAIAHLLYYRASITRRSKWAPRAYLSRLIALFCLARVVACVLRLVWIGVNTSALLVFMAVVAENAGTVLLVAVNFHLTKKMISFCNLKYSLWARVIIDKVANITVSIVFVATFLLNIIGVALYQVAVTSGRDPTIEAHLVQTSMALLVLFGLLFNLAVLATMLTTSWASVDRLTVKIITYLLGAGLLTLVSQLMRFVAAFMIWKPVTPLSAELLSKTAYYITGFGAEVLILLLYGFWETNLAALKRDSFLPRHSNNSSFDRSAMQTPTGSPRPVSQVSTAQILRVDSMSQQDEGDYVAGDDIDEGVRENYRSTIISSPPLDNGGGKDVEKLAGLDRPLAITVHKSFTVSTTRESKAIGKAI